MKFPCLATKTNNIAKPNQTLKQNHQKQRPQNVSKNLHLYFLTPSPSNKLPTKKQATKSMPDIQTFRLPDCQTYRHSDCQIARHSDIQIDRLPDIQTYHIFNRLPDCRAFRHSDCQIAGHSGIQDDKPPGIPAFTMTDPPTLQCQTPRHSSAKPPDT